MSRSTFAAVLFLAVGALPSCAPAAEDEGEDDASIDQAICAPEAKDVYLAARAATPLFVDERLATTGGTVGAKAAMVRLRVAELGAGETPYANVLVKTGPLAGKTGWVLLDALEVRTSSASADGSCGNGVDPRARASAAERALTGPVHMTAEMLRSTMMCLVGTTEGFFAGRNDTVDLAANVLSLARESWRRMRLAVLYSTGSDAAGRELRAAFADDTAKVNAFLRAVAHIVPTVHAHLAREWVSFRALEPEVKNRYLCRVVGRLTYETAAGWATAGTADKVSTSSRVALDELNVDVSRTVETGIRVGDQPTVTLDEKALARAALSDFGERFRTRWDELAKTSDPKVQQRLLRAIADDMNVVYKAEKQGVDLTPLKIGRGNCGNAALTTMLSLASGNPVCTLPYFEGTGVFTKDFVAAFERLGHPAPTQTLNSIGVQLLVREMKNGEMIWLASRSRRSGHATVLVKLDGSLYNLNNQGWEEALYVSSGELQTVADWVNGWQKRERDDGVSFVAIKPGLMLPTAAP